MVADQEHGFRIAGIVDQPRKCPSRVGPPVDIVADMDDPPILGRPGIEVPGDPPVDLGQQVGTAVHVADCVEAHPLRRTRVRQLHHRTTPISTARKDNPRKGFAGVGTRCARVHAGAPLGSLQRRPSRCAFLRASLRARRIASAFSRARFSDGFS